MYKILSSQFNYRYGVQIHFPYSIGRLVTYVKTNEEISSNFDFKPTFIFRDRLEEYVERSEDADILLCSCYVWNWEITKELARKIKKNNPNCLIIFGGPQVPDKSEDFLLKILNRVKPLKKFSSNIEESHKIVRHSSDLKTICSCSVLTIVFRVIEAIAILLVLQALGINFIEFFNILCIYSVSVILGSVSMSPGGLGITEGSFAGLLTLYKLELQTTLAVAVIVRFFTMWFAIVVGFISLKLSELTAHDK